MIPVVGIGGSPSFCCRLLAITKKARRPIFILWKFRRRDRLSGMEQTREENTPTIYTNMKVLSLLYLWIDGKCFMRLANTQEVINNLLHSKVQSFLKQQKNSNQRTATRLCSPIFPLYFELKATWAMNWMILTKMLRGVSLGTTLREPLGKSADTMLSSRLGRKNGQTGWVDIVLKYDEFQGFPYSGTDLCVTVLLSHLILIM